MALSHDDKIARIEIAYDRLAAWIDDLPAETVLHGPSGTTAGDIRVLMDRAVETRNTVAVRTWNMADGRIPDDFLPQRKG